MSIGLYAKILTTGPILHGHLFGIIKYVLILILSQFNFLIVILKGKKKKDLYWQYWTVSSIDNKIITEQGD